MGEKRLSEYHPIVISRQRLRILETKDAYYDSLITVEYVPITGGTNVDIKGFREEREGRDAKNK